MYATPQEVWAAFVAISAGGCVILLGYFLYAWLEARKNAKIPMIRRHDIINIFAIAAAMALALYYLAQYGPFCLPSSPPDCPLSRHHASSD
ncbi:MAG: hypothetical protein ACRED2_10035 [Methylocella sp.]